MLFTLSYIVKQKIKNRFDTIYNSNLDLNCTTASLRFIK